MALTVSSFSVLIEANPPIFTLSAIANWQNFGSVLFREQKIGRCSVMG
jgi:hypothetical protein